MPKTGQTKTNEPQPLQENSTVRNKVRPLPADSIKAKKFKPALQIEIPQNQFDQPPRDAHLSVPQPYGSPMPIFNVVPSPTIIAPFPQIASPYYPHESPQPPFNQYQVPFNQYGVRAYESFPSPAPQIVPYTPAHFPPQMPFTPGVVHRHNSGVMVHRAGPIGRPQFAHILPRPPRQGSHPPHFRPRTQRRPEMSYNQLPPSPPRHFMEGPNDTTRKENLTLVARMKFEENLNFREEPDVVKPESYRTRLCRHFLRGHCKHGDRCNFRHRSSLVEPSDQIVFLGGLPPGVTTKSLIDELQKEYQVGVINKPQIFEGFTPRVVLDSLENAANLIKQKKIRLFGRKVDVRPYEDRLRSEEQKRMVFIGGLPHGMTVDELVEGMRKQGFEICNRPHLGEGYARDVELKSEEQANNLVRKKQIELYGSVCDIRPFVNVYAQNRYYVRKTRENLPAIRKHLAGKKISINPELSDEIRCRSLGSSSEIPPFEPVFEISKKPDVEAA